MSENKHKQTCLELDEVPENRELLCFNSHGNSFFFFFTPAGKFLQHYFLCLLNPTRLNAGVMV